ncbi:cyclic nucleotide-binding domain-containing protein [Magnetospirillum sp. UT-4]|uniref:cyclic nucleotide-binding domain-containing protein n=1 Tax=Magnetospirillum sp. UT-4 TaxID=2681467 RepID=UPI00138282FC|nr:cyclic nucleotide-binding domain-containing protein [Magnetospirillum sp. UT-4]CAA7613553.1 Cyclic nucleotide-binding [Magnetospirillum sp. UT-4]
MVQPENLGRIIDEHPFFQGIDAKLRALLVGCAANERFEAGQFLFREGQDSNKFFLIRAGTVAVEIDVPGKAPIIIETIGEGEVAGWAWVVPPHRATFDARAMTLVRAVSFDAKCLRGKMDADPALGYEVLRRFVPMMAHRLSAARMQMLDLYGPGAVPARLKDEKKAKVAKAVKTSKGRNRAPDARLAAAAKDTGEKAKARTKVAKEAKPVKAPKAAKPVKAPKAAKAKKKAG